MKVREVELTDFPAVSEMMVPVGWKPVTERRWRRDWEENPALDKGAPPVSRGWVLQDDERTVGFLGNLIQQFVRGGRPLRAASTWGFVVAPEARGGSMLLLRAFVKQKNVDLLLATTASVRVPEILGLLKFDRLPVRDFDVGLYWVTGARGLVESNVRRMGAPGFAAALAGVTLAPALWAETRLRGRRPARAADGLEVEVLAPAEATEEFDELWEARRRESRRLAAVRTADVLRWHFAPEGWSVAPVLLAARRGGSLVGYAALVRSDKEDSGLRRWQIADLVALSDEPAVVQCLLEAAYHHAVADRVHILEFYGIPEPLRPIVQQARPLPWKRASWPYLYRASDPELRAALASSDAWYPTLIDGDGCLMHL